MLSPKLSLLALLVGGLCATSAFAAAPVQLDAEYSIGQLQVTDLFIT